MLLQSEQLHLYFNSQPHKEADKWACAKILSFSDISTHSLTRRLTALAMAKGRVENISTHSLTRRLTYLEESD